MPRVRGHRCGRRSRVRAGEATMKKGQNGSSGSSERNPMFGENVQTPSAAAAACSSSSSSSSSLAPSSEVTSIDGVRFSEGDLLLQALNGFVLVVTAEGYVFYTTPTIQDFLGFHESVFELIHTDDRALFRRQLHFSLNPNTVHKDGTAVSPSEQSSAGISSNVALNFHGCLKFVHGQHRVSEDGTLIPPQLALFSIATPMQPPSILEIRTKTLLFQTKHKLDFTPLSIDSRGKVVLGYSEVELRMKVMKTGESGFTIFRLLSKSRKWVWVQASARLVFKEGRPDFVMVRQKVLTNEDGEEQLRLRRQQLPFNFATGEALLYDIAPTVDIPDPCSAPKQRKLDNYTVSPDSILGCMLSQDQSIYCEHNDTLNSLNDTAFKDTHATVSVPGDLWQLTSPKPAMGSLVKSEGTVQDMMETLQQILGDSDLCNTVDVEPEELKSWESTLLKISNNSCEINEELDHILSNDILSYVEEQLQKEGGFKLPDQLNEIPSCLSTLDLQNQIPGQAGVQNFGWPLEPQNQLIPNEGQMVTGQPTPVVGMMKLTHMDLPQLSSGLNGPTLQQIASQQTVPTSAGLQMGTTGNTGAPVTFNPSVGAKTQNQLKKRQLNPMFSFQGNQWTSSVPNSNQADSFVETYAPNISNEPGFAADPSLSSCPQGHFALQTQTNDNQRQSWLLEQQLISSGHQGACLSQMSGFQRNPLPGVTMAQKAVNSRPTFRASETSNVPFPVQQVMEPPLASSSSCMFRNAPASVPVNGVNLGQTPSCQRPDNASQQIPSKLSCFYQGLPGSGSVPVRTSVPEPDGAALSCQITAGLDMDNLLFSEQTQINSCPVDGNGFPFSSLPNGTAYYSESK
ncbi:hypothetical protein FQN60_006716 [Etheostoma spectabile]|uniref:PAS domain-containing protein n=1 Tax=Etheostoma spectabile TaxID=54343 RepID=A0A5J5CF40_9PERO|nr:hypothetical protein FQN60_006716 [Etheostoma spectabile]